MARRKYFNRTKILNRDGGQCQDCGATDNLEIHHADGDPSNNHPSNAKTVCKDCHRKYTNQQLKEIAERQAIERDQAQQRRLDQIHANDALIEQAALDAWCDQGGSRRDWGGSEFHEFLRKFIKNT